MVNYRSDDTDEWSTTAAPRSEPPVPGEQRASIDELLSLLGHRRRRDVLYSLVESEVTDVESLAATIAARESDGPSDGIDDERDAVVIDLYHNHLPKLNDRGLIEYDSRSGAVRWTSLPTDVETLLECCHSLETDSE
jgi:DNA-binding transcriptional ArsR family regulator